MNNNILNTSIEHLKGIGPEKAKLINKYLSIYTYWDFLNFFPYRYADKSKIYTIAEIATTSTEIQLKGKIISLDEVTQNKKSRLTGIFEDETGQIELVWFTTNQWLKKSIPLYQEIIIYGKTNLFNQRYNISHPEIEKVDEKKSISPGLTPIYSSSEKIQKRGVNQRLIKNAIQEILSKLDSNLEENLSNDIITSNKLISRKEASIKIHFPQSSQELEQANQRLKFEEIFFFQLGLALKKEGRKKAVKSNPMTNVGEYFNYFYSNLLPFPLTNAQKRVIKEIHLDMKEPIQMNRLLQGDVGSGKTIVALLSMLISIDNGFQTCIIAPTEILATQHFNSFQELLKDTDINIKLLTGSTPTSQRKTIHEKLANGTLNILIGTHALLEDIVVFKNLGLAIIDEQHKFGVEQRGKLWKKNTIAPHILVMTATPIPRTLAMSFYSDLDISIIDELPAGRKEIKTVHRYNEQRNDVFNFIKFEIAEGRQAYIVYPLINESENLNYKALIESYDYLAKVFPPPTYNISIVHGKMKPSEKEFEMTRFLENKTQIMVATTVIEVGVNVPNASVMVIESSEKFGLSQLHQLRGRVGRGAEQSYCILMSKRELSANARKRIKTMVSTNDGFKISETDLELRGPGNLLGTEQSGLVEFKKLDLIEDREIINLAKKNVDSLITADPTLSLADNKSIRKYLIEKYRDKIEWSNII